MINELYQQILTIVAGIIGGIDVIGLLGIIVYVAVHTRSTKKAIKVTQEQIEIAFKNAVLPKNIRLDVSSKIEKPIREGLQEIELYLKEKIEHVEKGEQLILSILSLFSHVKQLSEDVRQQIADYLEPNIEKEIKLE